MKYLIKFLTDPSVYTGSHFQTSVHSGNFVGMHVRTSVICWILYVGSQDSSVLRGGTLIHISTWIHFACARKGGGLSDFSLMFLCFLSTPLTCWINKKCYYNTGQKTVWHIGWVQPFCAAVWTWGRRLERRCPCSCSCSSFGLAGKQAAGRGEYSPSAGSALGLCPGPWSSCSDPSVLSQEGGSTIQCTCQPGQTPVPAIQEILTA